MVCTVGYIYIFNLHERNLQLVDFVESKINSYQPCQKVKSSGSFHPLNSRA